MVYNILLILKGLIYPKIYSCYKNNHDFQKEIARISIIFYLDMYRNPDFVDPPPVTGSTIFL